MRIIENLLNQGENSRNIWEHALTCMHDQFNEIINSQINAVKYEYYALWRTIYKATGYDLREVELVDGIFRMPDGTDILRRYEEGEEDSRAYKTYSDRIKKYLKTGWDKNNDLEIEIGYNCGGLYDIGQERGYGIFQSDWIRNKETSFFDAKI